MPFAHESARVQELITMLDLVPHPEGGYYRRNFRSTTTIRRSSDRVRRAALTGIFYLLPGGKLSRWHRVRADETWHHYEGAPLELLMLDPIRGGCITHSLGPIAAGQLPQHSAPAGTWQAARAPRGYALVGCSVAPGFEYEDFDLLADDPVLADALLRGDEGLRGLL